MKNLHIGFNGIIHFYFDYYEYIIHKRIDSYIYLFTCSEFEST